MSGKIFENKYKISFVSTVLCIALLVTINAAFAISNADNFSVGNSIVLNLPVIQLVLVLILMIISLIILKKATHSTSKSIKNDELITALKNEIENQAQMIDNIKQLYENSLNYNNSKTEFFANICHELKTPLTVILGAIQLIDQNKSMLPVERRKSGKHIQTIKQNCYRLLRLINNLLDVSRLDSGYVKTHMVNCNIIYLVEEITQSVVLFAEQRKILLEFDTDTEEVITSVDIDKIERIVLNLLSNAIKFTPKGGKISVKCTDNKTSVLISVKDSGPGIPRHMHTQIFERFRQVNSSLTRDSEGSGIGLSLVKSFVELHGGSVRLISEEDQGSEFIVEIPVKICDSSSAANLCSENSQNKIIEAINIEFSDIYSIAS